MPCDYKIYPKDWKTVIVHAILARAGEVRDDRGKITKEATCEQCGAINHSCVFRYDNGKWDYCKDWVEPPTICDAKTKIVLTIAHLDHDAENHDVSYDRLKALCQKCHNTYDMPFRVANRKKKLEIQKGQQKLF